MGDYDMVPVGFPEMIVKAFLRPTINVPFCTCAHFLQTVRGLYDSYFDIAATKATQHYKITMALRSNLLGA